MYVCYALNAYLILIGLYKIHWWAMMIFFFLNHEHFHKKYSVFTTTVEVWEWNHSPSHHTWLSMWLPIRAGDKFSSLAPGKFEWNFRYAIFKRILVIDGWDISFEIALMWMPLNFTDNQSTLVQVMAWCRQATSHYLGQCWPWSLSPYGVIRPQWVNPR